LGRRVHSRLTRRHATMTHSGWLKAMWWAMILARLTPCRYSERELPPLPWGGLARAAPPRGSGRRAREGADVAPPVVRVGQVQGLHADLCGSRAETRQARGGRRQARARVRSPRAPSGRPKERRRGLEGAESMVRQAPRVVMEAPGRRSNAISGRWPGAVAQHPGGGQPPPSWVWRGQHTRAQCKTGPSESSRGAQQGSRTQYPWAASHVL
jgi:hypothetical protein